MTDIYQAKDEPVHAAQYVRVDVCADDAEAMQAFQLRQAAAERTVQPLQAAAV